MNNSTLKYFHSWVFNLINFIPYEERGASYIRTNHCKQVIDRLWPELRGTMAGVVFQELLELSLLIGGTSLKDRRHKEFRLGT